MHSPGPLQPRLSWLSRGSAACISCPLSDILPTPLPSHWRSHLGPAVYPSNQINPAGRAMEAACRGTPPVLCWGMSRNQKEAITSLRHLCHPHQHHVSTDYIQNINLKHTGEAGDILGWKKKGADGVDELEHLLRGRFCAARPPCEGGALARPF